MLLRIHKEASEREWAQLRCLELLVEYVKSLFDRPTTLPDILALMEVGAHEHHTIATDAASTMLEMRLGEWGVCGGLAIELWDEDRRGTAMVLAPFVGLPSRALQQAFERIDEFRGETNHATQ